MECGLSLPGIGDLEYAVRLLAERYPGDAIAWRGGGRGLAEQAVSSAWWAFIAARGSCVGRLLAAASTLFYEIAMLHPLTDGNKRLSLLVLDAFLLVHGLPRPERIAEAVLLVTSREWGVREVYEWLLRVAGPAG